MYCKHCGTLLLAEAQFCSSCGKPKSDLHSQRVDSSLVGFSTKINDPAFARYLKQSNHWSVIFALILAVAAVVGFYISGETSSEMSNPEAMYIGFGIGGMFLLIAFFQVFGRKRSKTWDGVVEDKKIIKRTERSDNGDDSYYSTDYLEYTVVIRDHRGKKHNITAKNDDTLYNYYNIGDLVRHHAGLNSYEKYNKSNDNFIPCNACASLNDIKENFCFRCKCPLLK
ncbi:MAG: zinc-ribbon domain-containing protein [Saccharofermentanales bacterium]